MNDWKKEWLEKNGFKWIGDRHYIYESEGFELEVKEDDIQVAKRSCASCSRGS